MQDLGKLTVAKTVCMVVLVFALVLAVGLMPGAAKTKQIRFLTTETDPLTVEIDLKAIRDFEEQFPDVQVKREQVDVENLWPKIMASVRAGTQPELVLLSAEAVQTFIGMGLLEPLNDVVDRIGRDDFLPWALPPYTSEGNNYGIYPEVCTWELFYRTDLFEDKGLEPPQYWDEMLDAAEKLTEDIDGDGKTDRWGFTQLGAKGSIISSSLFAEIWRNNGQIFDKENNVVFDSVYREESIEALDYMRKLVEYCPPGVAGYGYFEAGMAYTNEKAAMCRYAGRLISHIERHNPEVGWKTATVISPIPRGGRYISIAAGAPAVIFKGCKYLQAAKDFMCHYLTGESYDLFIESVPLHIFPPRKSLLRKGKFLQTPMWQKYSQIWEQMIEASEIPGAFIYPTTEHMGVINPYIGDCMGSQKVAEQASACLAGRVSPEEAIDKGGAAYREIIKRKKARK